MKDIDFSKMKKKDLIALLTAAQSLLDEKEGAKEEEKVVEKKPTERQRPTYQSTRGNKKQTGQQKRQATAEPINISSARPNLFEEQGFADMHKRDSKFDKKVSQYPPTPRRQATQFIKVECANCGTIEEVHPNLIASNEVEYKCNDCIGQ